MSDSETIPTPRTDSQRSEHIGFFSCATVTATFARQLERELSKETEAKYRAMSCAADAIEENARLREITKRLQKIASAFLGWHSEELSIEAFREITAALIDANDILPTAEVTGGATTTNQLKQDNPSRSVD